MKIGLCQVNPTVGDLAGNRKLIERFAGRARQEGARLVVFPELVVCGYPPEDLLLRPAFIEAHDRSLEELASNLPPDVCVLVGCIGRNEQAGAGGRPLHNAVAAIEDGIARIVARKCLLPTYDVFDESRYFEPWKRPRENSITVAGMQVGIAVCEDGWNDAFFFDRRRYDLDPVECLCKDGARVIVNLSAGPWARGKEMFRYHMVRAAVDRHRVPIVYVNQVGGNVGLQFDGSSLAVKPEGVAFRPRHFEEALWVVDTEAAWTLEPEAPGLPEMHHLALVQGISDYGRKFGFPDAVVGLSGGIDSAVTAVLAADALGPDHVVGLAMPSTYSSAHSVADARQLAENLGIRLHVLPIEPLQDAYASVLEPVFAGSVPGVAEENLQARARGALLMAYANRFGHLLLTTGNKSECAVGYCTLYGDMCGALAVIADLWKTEVYALARWINRERPRIPESSIAKAPAAELRRDHFDTDSLPPYEQLDPVLRLLVENEAPVEEAASRTGMPREKVAELYRLIMRSEFKRYQYAPTLRVSDRCWDGRRLPVVHRFTEE